MLKQRRLNRVFFFLTLASVLTVVLSSDRALSDVSEDIKENRVLFLGEGDAQDMIKKSRLTGETKNFPQPTLLDGAMNKFGKVKPTEKEYRVYSYDSNWICYEMIDPPSALFSSTPPLVHSCKFQLGSNTKGTYSASKQSVQPNLQPHQLDWIMTRAKFAGTESVQLPGRLQFTKFDRWKYAGWDCRFLSQGASLPTNSRMKARSCTYTPENANPEDGTSPAVASTARAAS